MKDLAAILTALGVGAALKQLVEAWIKRRQQKQEQRNTWTRMFSDIHEVYATLNVIVNETNAHRALILRTNNGGGKPKLTGKLYSSVIYESYEAPLKSIRNDWQDQLLDKAYMQLLYEMDKIGYIEVHVDKLEEGTLRDLYTSQSIQYSQIYRMCQRENVYIYLSINFTEKPEDDARFRELMRAGSSRLISLFENSENI